MCLLKCVWVSVSKSEEMGVFAGDVPLPRVFSFLSFRLIASDAPSGICDGRWKRGRGEERRRETREDRSHGVRGATGCTEQHH